MDWFYAQNGQQIGPVAEAELPELVRTGVIQPETLVWHAGMTGWQPYSSIGIASGVATAAEPVRFCSSCGKPFPAADLAFFGESAVCAACKPDYVQRLRQGMVSTAGTAFNYAGFWIRFVAVLIDGVITGLAGALIGTIFVAVIGVGGIFSPGWNLLQLTTTALGVAYYTFFWTQYGATPGKMALKLKVITPDGGSISVGRAIGRYFAFILDGLTLGIGFMMAGWDPEKRALHDRLADTRVIRTQ
jgi:uncharacterized RDD family membrane protein YckC